MTENKLIMQYSKEQGTKIVKPKKKASESTISVNGSFQETTTTTRLCKVYSLSPELQAVVGCDHDTQNHVLSSVWKYIHEHNLQDTSNKKIINNDEKMKKVFGKDQIGILEVMVEMAMEDDV